MCVGCCLGTLSLAPTKMAETEALGVSGGGQGVLVAGTWWTDEGRGRGCVLPGLIGP